MHRHFQPLNHDEKGAEQMGVTMNLDNHGDTLGVASA
jgi:hypothetical protein